MMFDSSPILGCLTALVRSSAWFLANTFLRHVGIARTYTSQHHPTWTTKPCPLRAQLKRNTRRFPTSVTWRRPRSPRMIPHRHASRASVRVPAHRTLSPRSTGSLHGYGQPTRRSLYAAAYAHPLHRGSDVRLDKARQARRQCQKPPRALREVFELGCADFWRQRGINVARGWGDDGGMGRMAGYKRGWGMAERPHRRPLRFSLSCYASFFLTQTLPWISLTR